MNNLSELAFAYSPWFKDYIGLWLVLLGPIVLVIDAAALFALYSAYTSLHPTLLAYARAVVVLGAGSWMSASLLHWVRDRYAFRTRYVLTEQGISVEPSDGFGLSVSWSDFDHAIECRLCRYIQLFTPKLERPVVLTFGAGGGPPLLPRQKFTLASQLIRKNLGSRCMEKWY
jgi:hypothetical protein